VRQHNHCNSTPSFSRFFFLPVTDTFPTMRLRNEPDHSAEVGTSPFPITAVHVPAEVLSNQNQVLRPLEISDFLHGTLCVACNHLLSTFQFSKMNP
jgi:hypothetical protein